MRWHSLRRATDSTSSISSRGALFDQAGEHAPVGQRYGRSSMARLSRAVDPFGAIGRASSEDDQWAGRPIPMRRGDRADLVGRKRCRHRVTHVPSIAMPRDMATRRTRASARGGQWSDLAFGRDLSRS
jgi:hypothetical protein